MPCIIKKSFIFPKTGKHTTPVKTELSYGEGATSSVASLLFLFFLNGLFSNLLSYKLHIESVVKSLKHRVKMCYKPLDLFKDLIQQFSFTIDGISLVELRTHSALK